MHIYKRHNQSGATLVEVLVAIGLTGIMLPALAAAIITANYARPNAEQNALASGLITQLETATKNLSEQSWSNVATNGTYHPVISSGNWSLSSGSGSSGNFSDQVTISDVYRDTSDNIVTSGGTLDPSTKQITATVSWSHPTSSNLTSTFYLTRYSGGGSWTQTTQADFTGDSLSNITVTNNSGGEAELTNGQTSGTLTSSTFDAGSSVSFNYLAFTSSVPTGTTLKFQVASNNDNSTWNYVGPDGTGGSYFTSPAAIPLNAVSGRYFRYQASFATTNASLPVLNDLTLTYSN